MKNSTEFKVASLPCPAHEQNLNKGFKCIRSYSCRHGDRNRRPECWTDVGKRTVSVQVCCKCGTKKESTILSMWLGLLVVSPFTIVVLSWFSLETKKYMLQHTCCFFTLGAFSFWYKILVLQSGSLDTVCLLMQNLDLHTRHKKKYLKNFNAAQILLDLKSGNRICFFLCSFFCTLYIANDVSFFFLKCSVGIISEFI